MTQEQAIERQVGMAEYQNMQWMQKYTDLYDQGTASYNNSKNVINGLYGEAQAGLKGIFAQRDVALGDLLSNIRDTGRNQAARSGLVGGTQEAQVVEPAVLDATQQESGTRINMQSGLLEQYNQALTSLDQTNLARIGNLSQGMLGQIGTANSASIAALGNYSDTLGQTVGGAAQGFSTGMNIWDYFKGN